MKQAAPRSRAWVLVLALFLSIAAAAGQGVPPAASENPVFRVTTTLIQVDAVVTDSKGRQIIDLSADDFEILADGHPQPIIYFNYVRVAPDAVSATVPTKTARGPRSHLNNWRRRPPRSACGPRTHAAPLCSLWMTWAFPGRA
jgi:hypothetical protein